MVNLDWSHDGIFDHEVAHLLLSLVRDQKHAEVVDVAEKPRTKAPPIALNTVELLRVASSRLHIGPKQAMDIAERLYIEVNLPHTHTHTLRGTHTHHTHTHSGVPHTHTLIGVHQLPSY